MIAALKEKAWYSLRFFVPEWVLRLYEMRKWQRNIPRVPLPDAQSPYRVLVTPARHAGQGKLWAEALDKLDGVSAHSVTVENAGFGHDAEYRVSWTYATLSRRWQREMRTVLREQYTHLLVEASYPPLGGAFGGSFCAQLEWLQDQGIRFGFIAHGSEVRLPSRHMRAEPWSPFGDPAAETLTAALEEVAKKNASYYRQFDVPSFVSTAGLLADLPEAEFLGLTVDAKKYATDSPSLVREKFVVCHVSSHSLLKATIKLAPILRRLEDEGLIEFREYSGVAQDQVPGILASSDIVLDQFALGDYGVFACEGLASGRLVLSHVSEQVRADIVQRTGFEVPIPETTLDNVEWRIRDIVANPEQYREIAALGPEYIDRVHSGGFSARVLYEKFLIN